MKISLFKGILLAVFILAAIIGVFVFATHTSKTTTTASTIGTVVIWGTLPKDALQNMLTALVQTDQSLKGVSYVQKDPKSISTELASAIATGAAPDLVLDSQENLHVLSKFITTIPFASLSVSTFSNAFIAGANVFSAPDGYYGVPFLVDPLVLFANRSILASSGVPRAPATWEAFPGLVSKVATLTSTRQVTRALIALGTYNNVHDARGILSTLFLQQEVPISVHPVGNEVQAELGTAVHNGASPGSAVVGFYTQFADPSKVSYTWNASLPNSQQAFLAGDVALSLGFVSEARYLSAANPNLDFTVNPVPQSATASIKSAYGLIYAFMIPRGARNASGAFNAAILFANTSAQNAAASFTGLAPASLTALSDLPADPTADVAYAEALYAKGWLSPRALDTDAVFSGMITDVISGRSSVDTALGSAERSLTALLQQ